jgi:hypothetical protein
VLVVVFEVNGEGEDTTVEQSSSISGRDETSVPAAMKPIPPARETARASVGVEIRRIGAEDMMGTFGVVHG